MKFINCECEQDRRDDRCYGIITARSEYTPYTTPFVIGSTRCSLQFTVVLPHVGRCASLTLSRHPKGMYKSKVGVGTFLASPYGGDTAMERWREARRSMCARSRR